MKKSYVLIAAFMLLSAATAISLYPHLAVVIFARNNNVDVAYGQLRSNGLSEFIFNDLRAFDRVHGFGFSSSSARIKMIFTVPAAERPSAEFMLHDVKFIKKGDGGESSYKNIDGLVSLPLSGLWKYRAVSGKISAAKNGLKVKNMIATGDMIKFSCDGLLTSSNIVDADIVIYFDKSISDRIPAELSNMALRDEDEGWKSLAIKLEGDLAKPAIRVTGKLFRLNIGVK